MSFLREVVNFGRKVVGIRPVNAAVPEDDDPNANPKIIDTAAIDAEIAQREIRAAALVRRRREAAQFYRARHEERERRYIEEQKKEREQEQLLLRAASDTPADVADALSEKADGDGTATVAAVTTIRSGEIGADSKEAASGVAFVPFQPPSPAATVTPLTEVIALLPPGPSSEAKAESKVSSVETGVTVPGGAALLPSAPSGARPSRVRDADTDAETDVDDDESSSDSGSASASDYEPHWHHRRRPTGPPECDSSEYDPTDDSHCTCEDCNAEPEYADDSDEEGVVLDPEADPARDPIGELMSGITGSASAQPTILPPAQTAKISVPLSQTSSTPAASSVVATTAATAVPQTNTTAAVSVATVQSSFPKAAIVTVPPPPSSSSAMMTPMSSTPSVAMSLSVSSKRTPVLPPPPCPAPPQTTADLMRWIEKRFQEMDDHDSKQWDELRRETTEKVYAVCTVRKCFT